MKKIIFSFLKIELCALISSAWLSFCLNAFGWFFIDRANTEFPVDQVLSWMWVIFAVITVIILLVSVYFLGHIYAYKKSLDSFFADRAKKSVKEKSK